MKDYLNRLAKGDFEYTVPSITRISKTLEQTISADSGEVYHLEIEADGPMEVFVYASDSRVTVLQDSFKGSTVRVPYTVVTAGCKPDDQIIGKFTVVSNAGEYEIPYTFTVATEQLSSSIGNIDDLFRFAELTRTAPEEAVRIFKAPDFRKTVLQSDANALSAFDLLSGQSDIRIAIEEFLVAAKVKHQVHISALEMSFDLTIPGSLREDFELSTNTWGYETLRFETDAPFIRMKEDFITTDAFTGNRYTASFFVSTEQMHAGLNFGHIFIRIPSGDIVIPVTATASDLPKDKVEEDKASLLKHREFQEARIALTKDYLNFRFKKIALRQWISDSESTIRLVREKYPDELLFKLMQVQLLATAQRPTEAAHLLGQCEEELEWQKRNRSLLYFYSQYVRSLLKKDVEYTKAIFEEVAESYENGHDAWQMLWLMFYLDTSKERNASIWLTRIKDSYAKGCRSPIMYFEAVHLLNQHPELLRVLNHFERQTLFFGCRYGLITSQLSTQVAGIIGRSDAAARDDIDVLIAINKLFDDDELLELLVTQLIRTEKTGKPYVDYYEKAILRRLKVTRLYEFYVKSLDKSKDNRIPKIVLLYFQYDVALDYETKAYIYSYVCHTREENAELFEAYEPIIERFALEQLQLGRINSNLADCYRLIFDKGVITKDLALAAFKMLNMYRINCQDHEFVSVLVKHKESKEIREYNLVGHNAFVPMLTEHCAFAFKTQDGELRIGAVSYEIERVFPEFDLPDTLRPFCKDDFDYQIQSFERQVLKSEGNVIPESTMIDIAGTLLTGNQVTDEYASKLNNWLIEKSVDAGYLKANVIDGTRLERATAYKLIELYIQEGSYSEALKMVSQYGYTGCNADEICKLAVACVQLSEEEDRLVTAMAEYAFEYNEYTEETIQYLVNYYRGGSDRLFSIYRAVLSKQDPSTLQERMIVQMMFTNMHAGRLTEVFAEYYEDHKTGIVVRAYLNYHAFDYFVRSRRVNAGVFSCIREQIAMKFDAASELWKVSLLKMDSFNNFSDLSAEERMLDQRILNELCSKDLYFAFYRRCADVLSVPYSLLDKTIVEYRTMPGSDVSIEYTMSAEENKEPSWKEKKNMKMMMCGIYTTYFPMFYGDILTYQITADTDGKETKSDIQTIRSDYDSFGQKGRFVKINECLESREQHDMTTLKKKMRNLVTEDYVARDIFHLLNERG